VFGRDRADLGPSHAAGMAAQAIDSYGPMQARYARRTSAPRRHPEPDLPYRPPASSSTPGLQL
jgi:exodeoxyribonuclease V alpha subunit